MDKKKILIAAAAAVILIGGSIALYSSSQTKWANSRVMPDNITINGIDVSGMAKKEAKKLLTEKSNSKDFVIKEEGSSKAVLPLEGTKYKIMSKLDSCVKDAGYFSCIAHLFGKKYDLEIPMKFSSTTDEFKSALAAFEDARDEGRTVTSDAYVDLSSTEFKVVPEVYGTNIDRAKLKQDIRTALSSGSHSLDFNEEEYIDVPEVTKDSQAIKDKLSYCHEYLETEITYEFGSKSITLTPEQLDSMIDASSGKIKVKKDEAKDFIFELASMYNTYYSERTFKSTDGRTVTIPAGTYGYIIDQDKELKQLTSDLKSGKDISREPVYSVKGNGRNGVDDILDTYVECDLTKQHMYFYKNGKLIVDSACVSGRITPDEFDEVHGTVCGVFTIAYKQKDATLKGGDKKKGTDYESEVKYWMPFFNGIGLHDAPWRDKFGGKEYRTNGSHGCINLPESAAKKLFENIDSGTIVAVFY